MATTVVVASVDGVVLARATEWQVANRRYYFPMASLRREHFVDSPKRWR